MAPSSVSDRAEGSIPAAMAMVVMMIGRARLCTASRIASRLAWNRLVPVGVSAVLCCPCMEKL